MDYLTATYNDRQSVLDAAKANFFKSGGQVIRIETGAFTPRPARMEPALSAEELRQRELAVVVRELAKTMTRAEIRTETGLTPEKLTKICKKFNIVPLQAAGMHPNSRKVSRIDVAGDKKLVERIKAMASIGLSKTKIIDQVRIGPMRLNRLIDTYGIEFTKTV